MPLPKPRKGEKEQDFVSRCIKFGIDEGTFENTPKGRAQAAAACFSTWRESKKAMPHPDAGESRGDFMSRCVDKVGADDPKDAETICSLLWNESQKMMIKAALNGSGHAYADSLIAAGKVNKTAAWSFSAEDGNALLGGGGDDWANYGKHHLGTDASAPRDTKAHWKYPFAKGGTLYRSALTAIRQRAGQQHDTEIFNAAGVMLEKIDKKELGVINRAYSVLHVKSVDPELRLLRGMATTPSPDRLGDIVEPRGIKFANPMPLLWQHRHDKPVGWAKFYEATDDGIQFEAKMPMVEEAGALRDRIEEAWQSVKLGLVRGVSIGFRALEFSFLDKGMHFLETEVVELSLVTIPANMEATITSVRAMDTQAVAS